MVEEYIHSKRAPRNQRVKTESYGVGRVRGPDPTRPPGRGRRCYTRPLEHCPETLQRPREETFDGGDVAQATELHRRILPLVAVYTLSAPGFDSAKLAIKKLGFPPSPILPAPPDSDEAIETTLEEAGLLPVQGEA
jgi:hypothetical protein